MSNSTKPDVLEAGAGGKVILLHSSVAGARQWRSLMDQLESRFHLVAVNLYGYGQTKPWPNVRAQTLEDQALLLASLLPSDASKVSIVGHSFGGAVAMKAASLFKDRVRRLVLVEPNPFHLLKEQGRLEDLQEALRLRAVVKEQGAEGDWRSVAETFANYWTGDGSWDAMPEDRRSKFADALKPNFHEWDAVMNEKTPLTEWVRDLPRETTVVSAKDTVRAIRAIVSLLEGAAPDWRFQTIEQGGHMAALSMSDQINPIIENALR